MTELYELPTPAAGRVGICRQAIEDALKMGFSMNDCAVRLALNYKTFWQAFRDNKIVVPAERQLPLPEAPKVALAQVRQTKAAPTQVPDPPTPVAKRPLPGQTIPVGDGEAMVDAVEAKLGTNFFK